MKIGVHDALSMKGCLWPAPDSFLSNATRCPGDKDLSPSRAGYPSTCAQFLGMTAGVLYDHLRAHLKVQENVLLDAVPFNTCGVEAAILAYPVSQP